jgi:hypothetical protein
MEDLQDIELINHYIDGTLTNPEKIRVEERLASDADFRQTYADVQDAIAAVQWGQKDRIKEILKEEQAKLTQKSINIEAHRDPKRFALRGWAMAASIALLAVAGYWFLSKDDVKTEDLAFDYKINTWVAGERDAPKAKQNRDAILARFGTIEGEKIILGLGFYDRDTFDKAADILLTVNIPNDTLYIYQANALIKSNRMQQAISILEKIGDSSPIASDKNWYMAMAYLKDKNPAKAKALLTAIANDVDSDFQGKAEEILQKLK